MKTISVILFPLLPKAEVQNLFPDLKHLFSCLSSKISNLSVSLWGRHACYTAVILHKHLTILFELWSSAHYTTFEEWMLEMLHFDFAVIKRNTAANYIKNLGVGGK